ncbi:MAG: GIY-YIG nuclease family protein [Bacteroidota bacterium]
MGYSVYILYSPTSDKYYVGQSSNPERRLDFHNTIEKGFTARYRPRKLVFKKEFSSKTKTSIVEKRIKGWKSKNKNKKLINGEIQI